MRISPILGLVGIIAAAITITVTAGGAQQQLTPEQQTILRTTLSVEGWLTADEHKRFWAVMPEPRSPEVVAAWRRTMDRLVGLGMKFQLETWKSLQQSEHEGRVVKTAEYEDAKRALLADPFLGPQSGRAIQNAEGMFQAAANKSAFSAVGTPMVGTPMYLSADMIERTLSGIEGSFCRMRRLTEPEWNDQTTEFKYPTAHVNILNDCPLTMDQSQITTEQGVSAKTVMLSYGVSAQERFQISFTSLRGGWVDPIASLTNVARAALVGMGIHDTHPLVTTWRDHKTATSGGSASLSQGSISASVRVIEGPEVQGSWTLAAISSQSQLEAQILLGALEDRIVLK